MLSIILHERLSLILLAFPTGIWNIFTTPASSKPKMCSQSWHTSHITPMGRQWPGTGYGWTGSTWLTGTLMNSLETLSLHPSIHLSCYIPCFSIFSPYSYNNWPLHNENEKCIQCSCIHLLWKSTLLLTWKPFFP